MRGEKRTESVLLRLSPTEKASITRAADREGMSREDWIRSACLAYLAFKGDKPVLLAALEGAKGVIREFEAEAKKQFASGKRKA